MNQSIEEAGIGEEFAHEGYVYLKLSEGNAALVLDDKGDPVQAPTTH